MADLCYDGGRWYKPFQRGDRLQTSESDVYVRQILMSKDGPRTKRVKYL